MPDKKMNADKMYAYVAIEPDGTEGLVGVNIDGNWWPLAMLDEHVLDELREDVIPVARERGVRIEKRVYSVVSAEVIADGLEQPQENTQTTQ